MWKKKIKNKKKKIIITIVVIALLIVIWNALKPKTVEDEKIETEAIEKRTIAQSISSTGVIKANDIKDIVSTLTGMKITSVKVKEGDKVSAGDVICTFDTTSLANNLNDLQKSVSVTNAQNNLSMQGARRSLNDAISNRDTQVSVSQRDVDNAANAYNNVQNQLNQVNAELANQSAALASYQATYIAAENSFKAVESAYTAKEVAYNTKLNEVNQKQAEINDCQARLDQKIANGEADTENLAGQIETKKVELQSLSLALNSAQSDLMLYKTSTYDVAAQNFTPIQSQYTALSQAVSNLQGQKASLEANASSLKSAYDGTVTAYNTAVSTANSSVASLQDGLASQELASSIGTQSQTTQIKELQKQLAEGNLTAGTSGTVTKVNVKSGDVYTGSSIATIEGCEDFIIEAEIDEYDIADVKNGMKVLIKTDATRDEELEGRIIYTAVSSTASASAGVAGMTSGMTSGSNATYTVKIALDTPNDRLRLGMNAKLSIITEMKENIWTVPYDSVYTREDGTKYIEIAKNETGEEKEELDVQTGIEGSYYIEIISDKLKDGMKIVLPKINAGDSIENLLEMMGADAGI